MCAPSGEARCVGRWGEPSSCVVGKTRSADGRVRGERALDLPWGLEQSAGSQPTF